jgi:hypothetical protein
MTRNFMIAVLCAAIFSCTKENPIPVSTETTVPLPWKIAGVTPQTSTYTVPKQVDCNSAPQQPEKNSQGAKGSGHGANCNQPNPGYPGAGCVNSGVGGGGSDTGVYCCRLTPPAPPVDPPSPPER